MAFLLETLRLGLTNLRLRLLRSILTALGIILGVTAVILMVSIGEGKKIAALEQIERLGARNIIIRSVKPPESIQREQGRQQSWQTKYGITRADLGEIEKLLGTDAVIVPAKEVGGQVLRGDRKRTSQSYGTAPDLLEVAGLHVARGRYLVEDDLINRTSVAVIGHEVARTLFPFSDPIGNTLRIDQQIFSVVGILEPVGLAGGAGAALIGRDLNQDIHIPITTARQLFGDTIIRRGSGNFSAAEVQVHEIYFTARTRERVLVDADLIRRLMTVRHPRMDDVELIIPYELLQNARQEAMTANLVNGTIAAIALLVGGIGIMNIMLATVTERTREIGIRRALGATRRHITWQFLVESGVISAIGGLIGVGLRILLSAALPRIVPMMPRLPVIGEWFAEAEMPTQLTTWSIAVAFGVATLIGIAFGLYPARIASLKDPVEALRHD